MSNKRTVYTAEFKTKLVLEVLKNEQTLSEIASRYNVTPKNIQNWKKTFLANASIAMEPAKAVKEYKDDNIRLQQTINEYARTVGQLTIEKGWLEGKLKSLGLPIKKAMVEPKHARIPLIKQCAMLGLSRSTHYYQPSINKKINLIKSQIKNIHEELPIYGSLKVHQQLLEDGFKVCLNSVQKYRKELGLRAILAVNPPNTSEPTKEHKKYSYKLRGVDILRANQVWSTDITYIKIKGGMVYLAAIIDWYSKAVLSWNISNTMDSCLVMGVLNEALERFNSPEIFNTDQGSQYTSHIHTNTLLDKGIIVSMDGKGRATDNICIERFWRSAKCERIYLNEYNSLSELKGDVANYIDFYNYRRFHETLGYRKPMNVYNQGSNNGSPQEKLLLKAA